LQDRYTNKNNTNTNHGNKHKTFFWISTYHRRKQESKTRSRNQKDNKTNTFNTPLLEIISYQTYSDTTNQIEIKHICKNKSKLTEI